MRGPNMRETLTLIGERVATQNDFNALGMMRCWKTPDGWRHLVADFEVDAQGQLVLLGLGDIDTGKAVAPELTVNAMAAVQRHCRIYANLHGALIKNAPTPAH